MAQLPEIRAAIARADGHVMLVDILKNEHAHSVEARADAAQLLSGIVYTEHKTASVSVERGAVKQLVALLDEPQARKPAVAALLQLTRDEQAAKVML